MPLGDELTGLGAGAREAETVDDVVQAGFEQAEQVFTRHARVPRAPSKRLKGE